MNAEKIRILVVEDEEDHAELILRAFQPVAERMSLTLARSLEEARSRLAESTPELVITDLRLPDGEGTELIPAGDDASYPVVILTGHGDEMTAVGAIKLGALDYVIKSPASFEELPRIAERALREWNLITDRKRAEEALQKSEASLSKAQQIAKLGSWERDLKTNAEVRSEETCRIFGLDLQDCNFTYEKFLALVHPEDRKRVEESVSKGIEGKAPYSIDYRIITPGGDEKYIHSEAEIEFDADGQPIRMVGTNQDITERMYYLQTLEMNAEQQEAIARLGKMGLSGAELSVLFEEAASLTAQTLRVEYSKVLEFMPETGSFFLLAGKGWEEGLVGRASVEGGADSQAGYTFLTNEPVVVKDLRSETRFSGPPLLHDHGVVSGLSVIIGELNAPFGVLGAHTTRRREFSPDDSNFLRSMANVLAESIERKRAEEKIKESEATLKRSQKISHLGSWSLSLATKEHFWSEETYRIFGLEPEKIQSSPEVFVNAIHPDDREKIGALVKATTEKGEPYEHEFRIVRPGGEVRTVYAKSEIIKDREGRINRVMGSVLDITDRKQAEADLRNSEIKYRSMTESAIAAIVSTDSKGIIISWNPAAENIFGHTEAEIIGRPINLLIPRRYQEAHQMGLERMASGGEPHLLGRITELDALRKGGTEFPIEISMSQWKVLGETFFSGFIQDISARKKSEDELRKLNRAVEQSSNLIIVTDVNGIIEYINPTYLEVTGYDREEVIGENPRILQSGETPPEEYEKLWEAITSDDVWRGEFQNKKKNNELFWVSSVISPVKDDKGEITHFIGVQEDITERKRAEEELHRNQQLLIRAEKLSSIGVLTAGAAHEILNPANIIGLHGQRMLWESEEGSEGRETAEVIIRNVDRITRICDDLRRFSRDENPEYEDFDPDQALRDALRPLESELRLSNIQFEMDLSEGRRVVMGERHQLQQVFINLFSNAKDAMPEGGTLSIASEESVEGNQRWWVARVSDTGEGIPEDILPKIFDPFFTTKPEDKGTGLGLSVSYGIVEDHGGELLVESTPGEGTTFTIRLSIKKEEEEAEMPRILIVDDEQDVLDFLKVELEKKDYEVETALSGEEAVEKVKAYRPLLMLLDIRMPGMGGIEALKQAKEIDPKLGVIMVTAVHDEEIAKQAMEFGAHDYVTKPIDFNYLHLTVMTKIVDAVG